MCFLVMAWKVQESVMWLEGARGRFTGSAKIGPAAAQ